MLCFFFPTLILCDLSICIGLESECLQKCPQCDSWNSSGEILYDYGSEIGLLNVSLMKNLTVIDLGRIKVKNISFYDITTVTSCLEIIVPEKHIFSETGTSISFHLFSTATSNLMKPKEDETPGIIYHLEAYESNLDFLQNQLSIYEYYGDLMYSGENNPLGSTIEKSTCFFDKFRYSNKGSYYVYLAKTENIWHLRYRKSDFNIFKFDNSISDNPQIIFPYTIFFTALNMGNITLVFYSNTYVSFQHEDCYYACFTVNNTFPNILITIERSNNNKKIKIIDGKWDLEIRDNNVYNFGKLTINHTIKIVSQTEPTFEMIIGEKATITLTGQVCKFKKLEMMDKSVLALPSNCNVEYFEYFGSVTINGFMLKGITTIKPNGIILSNKNLNLGFGEQLHYIIELNSNIDNLQIAEFDIPSSTPITVEFTLLNPLDDGKGKLIPTIPAECIGLNKTFLKTINTIPSLSLFYPPENIYGFNSEYQMVTFNQDSFSYSFNFDSDPTVNINQFFCQYENSDECPEGTKFVTKWEDHSKKDTKILELYIDHDIGPIDFMNYVSTDCKIKLFSRSQLSIKITLPLETLKLDLINVDATILGGSVNCEVDLKSSSLAGSDINTSTRSIVYSDSYRKITVPFYEFHIKYKKKIEKIDFQENNEIQIKNDDNSIIQYKYLNDAQFYFEIGNMQPKINLYQATTGSNPKKFMIKSTNAINTFLIDGLVDNFWTIEMGYLNSITIELNNNAIFPYDISNLAKITFIFGGNFDTYICPYINFKNNPILNVKGTIKQFIIEEIHLNDSKLLTINTENLINPIIIRRLYSHNVKSSIKALPTISASNAIQINRFIYLNEDSGIKNFLLENSNYDERINSTICFYNLVECPDVDDTLLIEQESVKDPYDIFIQFYKSTSNYTTIKSRRTAIKQIEINNTILFKLYNADCKIDGKIDFDIILNNSSALSDVNLGSIGKKLNVDGKSSCNIIFDNIFITPTIDIKWLSFGQDQLSFEQYNINEFNHFVKYNFNTSVTLEHSNIQTNFPIKSAGGHPKSFTYNNLYQSHPLLFYSCNDFSWFHIPYISYWTQITIGWGGGGSQPYNLGNYRDVIYQIIDEGEEFVIPNISETISTFGYPKNIYFKGNSSTQIRIKKVRMRVGNLLSINFYTDVPFLHPIIVEKWIGDNTQSFGHLLMQYENGGINVKIFTFLQSSSYAYHLRVVGEENVKDAWTIGYCVQPDESMCEDIGPFKKNETNPNADVSKITINFDWSYSLSVDITLKAKEGELQTIWMDECRSIVVGNAILNLQGDFSNIVGPLKLYNSGLIGNPIIDHSITVITDGLQSCEVPFQKMQIDIDKEIESFDLVDGNYLVLHIKDYKDVFFGYTNISLMTVKWNITSDLKLRQRSFGQIDFPKELDLTITDKTKIIFDGISKCEPFLKVPYSLTSTNVTVTITNNSHIPFNYHLWRRIDVNIIENCPKFEIDRIDPLDEYTSYNFQVTGKTFSFTGAENTQVYITTMIYTAKNEVAGEEGYPITIKLNNNVSPPILINNVVLCHNPKDPKIISDGSVIIGSLIFDETNDQSSVSMEFVAEYETPLKQIGLCASPDFEQCIQFDMSDFANIKEEEGTLVSLENVASLKYGIDKYNANFFIEGKMKIIKQMQLHNPITYLKLQNVEALISGRINYVVECITSEIKGRVIAEPGSKLITNGKFSSSLEFSEIEVTFNEILDHITFNEGTNITYQRNNANSIFICFKTGGIINCNCPSGQTSLKMSRLGEVPSSFTLKGNVVQSFYFSAFDYDPLFLHVNFASYEILSVVLSNGSSIPLSLNSFKTIKTTFDGVFPTFFIKEIDLSSTDKNYEFINGDNTQVIIDRMTIQNDYIIKFKTSKMIPSMIINEIKLINVKGTELKPSIDTDTSIEIKSITPIISANLKFGKLQLTEETNEARVGICILPNESLCKKPNFNANNEKGYREGNTIEKSVFCFSLLESPENGDAFNFYIYGKNKIIHLIKLDGMNSAFLKNVNTFFYGSLSGDFNVINSEILGNANVTSEDMKLFTDGKKSSSIKFPNTIISFTNIINEIIFNENENVTFTFLNNNIDPVYYCYIEDVGKMTLNIKSNHDKLVFEKNGMNILNNLKINSEIPINKYRFSSFIDSPNFIEVNKDINKPLVIELENNSKCLLSYEDWSDVTIQFIGAYNTFLASEIVLLNDKSLKFIEGDAETQITINKLIITKSCILNIISDTIHKPITINSIEIKNNIKNSTIINDNILAINYVSFERPINSLSSAKEELSIFSKSWTSKIGICLQNDLTNCIKTSETLSNLNPTPNQINYLSERFDTWSNSEINDISIHYDFSDDVFSICNIRSKTNEIKQIHIQNIKSISLNNIFASISGTLFNNVYLKNSKIEGDILLTNESSLTSDGMFSCLYEFPIIMVNFEAEINQVSFSENNIIKFKKIVGSSQEILSYKYKNQGNVSIKLKGEQIKLTLSKEYDFYPNSFNIIAENLTEYSFESFSKDTSFIKTTINENNEYVINLANGGYSPLPFNLFNLLTVNFIGIYKSYEIDQLSIDSYDKIFNFNGNELQIYLNLLTIKSKRNMTINTAKTNHDLLIRNIELTSSFEISKLTSDKNIIIENIETNYEEKMYSFEIEAPSNEDNKIINICLQKDLCINNDIINIQDNKKDNISFLDDKTTKSISTTKIIIQKSEKSKDILLIESNNINIKQLQISNMENLLLKNVNGRINEKFNFNLKLINAQIDGTGEANEDSNLMTDGFRSSLISFRNIEIICEELKNQIIFDNNDEMKIYKDEVDICTIKIEEKSICRIHFISEQQAIKYIKVENGTMPQSICMIHQNLYNYYFRGFKEIDQNSLLIDFPKNKEEELLLIELNDNSICPFDYYNFTNIKITFSGQFDSYYIPKFDSKIPKTYEFRGNDVLITIGELNYIDGNDIKFNINTNISPNQPEKEIVIKLLKIKKASQVSSLSVTRSITINAIELIQNEINNGKGDFNIQTEDNVYETFLSICLYEDSSKCRVKEYSDDKKKELILNENEINRKTLKRNEKALDKMNNLTLRYMKEGTEDSMLIEQNIDMQFVLNAKDKNIQHIILGELNQLTIENSKVEMEGNINFNVQLINSEIFGNAIPTEKSKLITDCKKSSIAIPFPEIEIRFIDNLNNFEFDNNNTLKNSYYGKDEKPILITFSKEAKITLIPGMSVDKLHFSKQSEFLPSSVIIVSESIFNFHFSRFFEPIEIFTLNLDKRMKITIDLDKGSLCPLKYQEFNEVLINLGIGYEIFFLKELSMIVNKKIEINSVDSKADVFIESVSCLMSSEVQIIATGITRPIIIEYLLLSKKTISSKLITKNAIEIKTMKMNNENSEITMNNTYYIDKSNQLTITNEGNYKTFIGICTKDKIEKCEEININSPKLSEQSDNTDGKLKFEYIENTIDAVLEVVGSSKKINQAHVININELKLHNIKSNIRGDIGFKVTLEKSEISSDDEALESSSLSTDENSISTILFPDITLEFKENIDEIKLNDHSNLTIHKDSGDCYISYKDNVKIKFKPSAMQTEMTFRKNTLTNKIPSKFDIFSEKIVKYNFYNFEKNHTFMEAFSHQNITINIEDGYIPMKINFEYAKIQTSKANQAIFIDVVELSQNKHLLEFPNINPIEIDIFKIVNDSPKKIDFKSNSSIVFNKIKFSEKEKTLYISNSNSKKEIKPISFCINSDFSKCPEKDGNMIQENTNLIPNKYNFNYLKTQNNHKRHLNNSIKESREDNDNNKEESILIVFNEGRSNVQMKGAYLTVKEINLLSIEEISLYNFETKLEELEARNIIMSYEDNIKEYNLENFSISTTRNITFNNVDSVSISALNLNDYLEFYINVNNSEKTVLIDNIAINAPILNGLSKKDNSENNHFTFKTNSTNGIDNINNSFNNLFYPKHDHISQINKRSHSMNGLRNLGNKFVKENEKESLIYSKQPIKVKNIHISSNKNNLRMKSKIMTIDTIEIDWLIRSEAPCFTFDYSIYNENGDNILDIPNKIPKSILNDIQNKPLKNLIINFENEISDEIIEDIINNNKRAQNILNQQPLHNTLFSENGVDLNSVGTFVENVFVPPDQINFPTIALKKNYILKLDLKLEKSKIIGDYLLTQRIDSIIIPAKFFYVFWFSILGVVGLMFISIVFIIRMKNVYIKNKLERNIGDLTSRDNEINNENSFDQE